MNPSVLVLAVVSAGASFAQTVQQVPYERILVPIVISQPVQGAYDSVWTTELVGRNTSDDSITVTSTPTGLCTLCPVVPAHTTFPFPAFVPDANGGVFLYIDHAGASHVIFNLRVQDRTRQAQTWGTEIPIVTERDVFTRTLHLLDIPVDSHFRSALRVYDFDTPADGSARSVRVRIFDMCGVGPLDSPCADTPLADFVMALQPNGRESSQAFPEYPGTAMIGDVVSAFPQLRSVPPTTLANGASRPAAVRIEIEPLTENLRFWGFVSATNNETQHVTIIAPH